MNRRVFLVVAILLPVTAAGCALAALAVVGAAVAGTYLYLDGEAKQDYSSSLPACWAAAKRTAHRVGLGRLTRHQQRAKSSAPWRRSSASRSCSQRSAELSLARR